MDRTTWFREARFGMMAHWGVYSAIGRGEWVLNRERMPLDAYRAAAESFTAERFDADAWAALAEAAGQRYLVVTAKHHDGYCLWDTATTDWCATRTGPRRDLIGELVTAFRGRGLRIGFFFSLADWMHPAYPTPYAVDWPPAWRSDDDRRTLVAYAQAQVAELMRYRPDLMWFDGAAPGMSAAEWDGEGFFTIIRAAQPECLINQRLFLPGDFDALELHLRTPETVGRPYESDWTLNESWAWNPGDRRWKRPLDVVRRLLHLQRAEGGNLLLNVSPRGDGSIVPEEEGVLREVGAWLRGVDPVIFCTRSGELAWEQWGEVTTLPEAVVLHCWQRAGDELVYAGITNCVRRAQLLHDGGRELPFSQDGDGRVVIRGLAGRGTASCGCCIRLDLDGPPRRHGVGHAELNF